MQRAPNWCRRALFAKGWTHWKPRLSDQLVLLLIVSMTLVFGLLGMISVSLQRRRLERNTLASAENLSDVIKRNANYYMLRNERDGLYHLINEVASEPGVVRIRIINPEGRITFSSDPNEIDTLVDKRTEACYGCHLQSKPLSRLNRPDRFRTYSLTNGERALGIINPIGNSSSCSNSACHYHPASQEILGVLDTNLSLAKADADIAQSRRQTILYTGLAILAISSLSGFFVWRVVRVPLARLQEGTERLRSGELGYQLHVGSNDELAELADSFNTLSRHLQKAREEIDVWTRTLEERVVEKTRQLNAAHEQMLHAEKMASIGKLSAVVAHEINNPLAGILTYAKLLKKRFRSDDSLGKEVISTLDIIESESRRCGDIVKNLMTFARKMPMSREPADLNATILRCAKLVQHRLDLASIELRLDLADCLPQVFCDASQIGQVILALVMNAIEAMPHGGVLTLKTAIADDDFKVQIEVRDNGVGISPDVLADIFEPFFTTKESGPSLGLGLAVSHGIVERHGGEIHVESDLGRGTAFVIRLPLLPSVEIGAASVATEVNQGER